MSKVFKFIVSAWFVNLIVFTTSLFLWHYYEHVNHWSEGAWEAIFSTSLFTKIALSVSVGVYICEYGVDGNKKPSK